MEQTVIQIGNSVGVVIPSALKKELNMKVGSKILVERDSMSNSLIVRKKGSKARSFVNSDFLQILKNVNEKYGKALKELALK